MLKDYTPLLEQAENVEVKDNKLVYDKAVKILDKDKFHRASSLISELSTLLNLSIIGFHDNKGKEEITELIGAILQLNDVVNVANELKKQVINSDTLTQEDKVKFEVMVDNARESLSKYYNYKTPNS